MIKPIPKYQNYYYTSSGQKKLYGLSADGVSSAIDIIDQDGEPLNMTDFFVKLDNLYFTIKTIEKPDKKDPVEVVTYYKQDLDGTVLEQKTLPEKPTFSRVTLDNSEFTIKDNSFENKNCTDVLNKNRDFDSGVERFYEVNAFSYFPESGIYIYVSDGRYNEKIMVKNKGLYYWAICCKRLEKIKLPEGEIW